MAKKKIREIRVKGPKVKEIKKKEEPEEEIGDEEEIEEEVLEEEVLEEEEPEEKSDFSIEETLLKKTPVHSWEGKNLEEAIEHERVEKDWGDSEEFIAGDFYKTGTSAENLYGTSSVGEDLYKTGDGNDLYNAPGSGGDLYNSGGNTSGDLYNAGGENSNSNSGMYNAENERTKTPEEINSERRAGRSMLEVVGFRDEEKEKERREKNMEKYHHV